MWLTLSFLVLSALRPLEPEESLEQIAGDLKIESGFKALTAKTPKEKTLLTGVWANGMWPFKNGGICRRKEEKYEDLSTWSERYRYIELNPLEDVVRERSELALEKRIQNLSPTEKYDLLMGNLDAPLTRFFWKYQKDLHENNELYSWRGVCEGSAAASAFWNGREPIKSLKIPSRIFGLSIPFSALDIKALGAIAFSQFQIEIPFIGIKNLKSKSEKGKSGEFLDADAFSLNPAAVFMAVLNFGSIHDIPMVIDKEALLPVWSVPIQSYRYRIRGNVETSKDKYRQWRNPQTTEIKEVEMTLTYADVNRDGIREEGRVSAPTDSLKMKFDLELNCNDPEYPDDCKIIGGEWHEDAHPDFLYLILKKDIPWSEPEARASFSKNLWMKDLSLKELKEVPALWAEAAHEAGGKGQVLWSVVERLFLLSAR